MTHTPEYRLIPGVVRHTFSIFGLFTTPNLCPPDTKSWRRHCLQVTMNAHFQYRLMSIIQCQFGETVKLDNFRRFTSAVQVLIYSYYERNECHVLTSVFCI